MWANIMVATSQRKMMHACMHACLQHTLTRTGKRKPMGGDLAPVTRLGLALHK